METRNLAHTCSSIPPPDIPFNSQQHNHLLSEAAGHIYSNDLPNAAAASMVSHEQQHIGSTDTPFIPEILDWDHHLLDLPLDFSPIQMEEEDGGILPSDENPIMSPYWNDLILDTSSTSASKVVHESTMQPQVPLQQPPSPCVELPPLVRTVSSNSNDNTSAAAKGRMRWTPELHEAFVEAVNHLGGMNNAKPKAVLKHMKVQGLTIYHVKSHLQKYRTARYVPEPSQGSQETKLTPLEHVTSLDTKRGIDITEALRIQMEVQKQLHEQLEVQRKMQLRIEEQGKVLLMMFEKQNMDFCKPDQEDKTSEKTPESCSEEADSPRPKRPRNNE
ncbi:myb family transcription factor PHL4 isoform X1 [Brassica rapa]|uniref:myb family transcription factor PHL4 isoform X1 n=1 Tax=Brassica campestris TaxID=3711 RepID=UPI00087345DE|nr:myb family transcription factor PHL4 isoform X1 [Brassica rapa]XP_033134768.1 myb family transcription factor PHL4 isoform X1 [Brassica rapa]